MGRFINKKKDRQFEVQSVEAKDEDQAFEGVLVGNGLYREVTLHDEDAGRTVEVKHFGEVIVSLQENISDGCKWVVENTGSMRVFDESKKNVQPGVSQERIFRLEPQQLGQVSISFKYANPWKDNSEVKKSAEFTVVVR